MIPERDYFLAKLETARRQQEAAEARAARRARSADHDQDRATEPVVCEDRPRGAFGWLRRLAGAR